MEEYKRIKEYIRIHNIKQQKYQKDDVNFYADCPFHDKLNKKCTIYPVRPEVCKNFQCYRTEKRIDKDRRYYDQRADINGRGLHRIVPLDLLFYNNPTTTIYLLMDILKNKTSYDEDYILKLLEAWASEVPQGIPNTKEIADAIRAGGIELEWR
jgi:Fe-S-cluster containining protein